MHGLRRIGDDEMERIKRERRTVERGSMASGDPDLLFWGGGCIKLLVEAPSVLAIEDLALLVLLTNLHLRDGAVRMDTVRTGRSAGFIVVIISSSNEKADITPRLKYEGYPTKRHPDKRYLWR